ncbi:MAG: hypothetical protein V1729_01250 [Candidatus Woesearchaeota archaeon]
MDVRRTASICALVTALAAAGVSGCAGGASYSNRGFKAQAYGYIDAPGTSPQYQKAIHRPNIVHRPEPTSRFPEKECVEYAASAAESRKKDGKRVTQCYYNWR